MKITHKPYVKKVELTWDEILVGPRGVEYQILVKRSGKFIPHDSKYDTEQENRIGIDINGKPYFTASYNYKVETPSPHWRSEEYRYVLLKDILKLKPRPTYP